MKRASTKLEKWDNAKWLIFFYSVPSKPVKNRVSIWRRLSKAGALQLKGSVYILPNNEDNYEFFVWLTDEVTAMHGEAAFLNVEKIETLSEREIIELFNQQRAKDYLSIEKNLEGLERIISSFKKGTKAHGRKKFSERFTRILRDFEEIKKIDFFESKAGSILKRKIDTLKVEINNLPGTDAVKEHAVTIKPRNPKGYQGRIWVTRKRPFVDRIASAWLIREFIDRKSEFKFIDENELKGLSRNVVSFDIHGGEFTHVGDMCTFEVLMKSFRIKDKAVRKISEIVHELDLKDEKYSSPESRGVEEVLVGIRKTAQNDSDLLEKGISVFRMLYASKIL